jgi:maltose O-acetyltransferase
MKNKLLLIYTWFVRLVLIWLPDAPIFMRFRGLCYGLGLRGCGGNFQVSASTVLRGLGNISVGSDVYLAPGCIINARGCIELDDEVQVGFNTVIVSSIHVISNGSYREKHAVKNIHIGKGSWIGANCTIAAGAVVPASSAIGANSFVNKELQQEGVYGGCPARLLKSRSQ